MNVQKQLKKIETLKKDIKKLTSELSVYLQKSVDLDLETRWNLYLSLEDSLPTSCFIQDLQKLHRDAVGYDCLVHAEHRDALINYSTIVGCLEDSFEYSLKTKKFHKVVEKMLEDGSDLLGITETDEYNARLEESFNAQLNALKLEILSLGQGGFHYDW